MPSFKKLALIATEIRRDSRYGDGPKTLPPAVFQKWAGGNKSQTQKQYILRWISWSITRQLQSPSI